MNRQKDIVDGKNSQILSNGVDSKLRDDLERLKKIRAHRGLRHFWGLRVRGQHTKTTGTSTICSVLFTRILTCCFLIVQAVAERPSVCRRSVVKLSALHSVFGIHCMLYDLSMCDIGMKMTSPSVLHHSRNRFNHDYGKTCLMGLRKLLSPLSWRYHQGQPRDPSPRTSQRLLVTFLSDRGG